MQREAWRRTRKDGAPGVDGVTADEYEADLEANLQGLLNRIKSGRYVAPPVRRHTIPKADGRQRPLGIPTLLNAIPGSPRSSERPFLLLVTGYPDGKATVPVLCTECCTWANIETETAGGG